LIVFFVSGFVFCFLFLFFSDFLKNLWLTQSIRHRSTPLTGSKLAPLPASPVPHSLNSSHAITTATIALAAADRAVRGPGGDSGGGIDADLASPGQGGVALAPMLFLARCSDLSITPVMTAYASFYASFESRVRWPALIVRGMGLGEMGGAALAIGMVAGGGRG
jgi:hypothetical protein